MTKLKGVCIGAGYFSQFHFDAWQRIPNVEIAAICDQQLAKAQTVCDTYGFKEAYDDVATMFETEKPDFVDIITPPETHLELCKLAIAHGIDIICQKPLAPTYGESVQIAEMVKSSGVRMMVHENFRFMPWYREIKKLLEQNTIGEKIQTIQLRMRMGDGWQDDAYMNRQPYFRKMERLLIYETGIHFIDVFSFLGGNIKSVYAKLRTLNPNIKGEDFAWVNFDFENGTLGFLDASRYNENTAEDPRLTFGTVLIDGPKGSIRLYDDGTITVQPLGKEETKHDYHFENKNFSGDCVFATQSHFIDRLRDNRPFETEVSKYLRNIEVQDAIYRSNDEKSPVNIA
ncbi:Gfo/Idh/MocA family protein [Zobellia uliginosa]|uniref:Gfo/Idh/MocA family protein n=1 Tax=Zobellia uliginosa TaxID=143224 RepID=UPI0026E363BB|nr:Gfo/Idh/MocA family oxidoreductase [Zobellia uliginosa]MDO6518251.1 Gfo/Idh/MocA family oxidoreductase [Zobellia uliginosa]